MELTTPTMPTEEVIENLKEMVFGTQAFERFDAKERETLSEAWQRLAQNIDSIPKERFDEYRKLIEKRDWFLTFIEIAIPLVLGILLGANMDLFH